MVEAKNIDEVEKKIQEINDNIQNSGIVEPDEMAVEFIDRLEEFKEIQEWDDEQEEAIEKHILALKVIHTMNNSHSSDDDEHEFKPIEKAELENVSYQIIYGLMTKENMFGKKRETRAEAEKDLKRLVDVFVLGEDVKYLYVRNSIDDEEANILIMKEAVAKIGVYEVTKFINGDYEAKLV